MEFEFATNTTVDNLDKVPEQFRAMYQAGEGGQFLATETLLPVMKAIDGLNKALKASRRDADEAKKNRQDAGQFKALGQLVGLEPEEVTADALKSGIEKALAESKEGKVNWDKMRKDLEVGFSSKLKQKDEELEAMTRTVQKYLVNSSATAAIAANKGVPELLLPHIEAKTKVIKEGDGYVVRVVDDASDFRGNAVGGFMTVEDLVKELKGHPVYGKAFENDVPPGAGVRPSTGPRAPVQQGNRSLSATDRIAMGLQKRGR